MHEVGKKRKISSNDDSNDSNDSHHSKKLKRNSIKTKNKMEMSSSSSLVGTVLEPLLKFNLNNLLRISQWLNGRFLISRQKPIPENTRKAILKTLDKRGMLFFHALFPMSQEELLKQIQDLSEMEEKGKSRRKEQGIFRKFWNKFEKTLRSRDFSVLMKCLRQQQQQHIRFYAHKSDNFCDDLVQKKENTTTKEQRRDSRRGSRRDSFYFLNLVFRRSSEIDDNESTILMELARFDSSWETSTYPTLGTSTVKLVLNKAMLILALVIPQVCKVDSIAEVLLGYLPK